MGTLCYVYVDMYLNNSVREIIYYTHHNKNASQGVLKLMLVQHTQSREMSHTSHRYGCCALCIHLPAGYTAPYILYYTHHRNKNGPHWMSLV
jgi:hypothetical protein